QLPVAGLIVSAKGNRADVETVVGSLRRQYPKMSILVLDTTGKQPMMRGQTITTEKGILQVSSPTAQPWLDSNLALARFDQEFYPNQRPLYTFQWEAGDSVQQADGISAEDYCL